MPRIRSTHAAQWNDDDFLECSPLARLLALAVRNFADDNGVFEWKPKQIKRNCLPSDACQVEPLLAELLEHNQVARFTADGKDYGAIRNFRKWQRPKSPNSTYQLPSEFRKYVGLSDDNSGNQDTSEGCISEIEQPSGHTIPPPVPKSAKQREEVGGRRKEEGVGDIPLAKANGSASAANADDSPPAWWPCRDRYGRVPSDVTDKTVFDVGKAVLGNSSGGQIKKLQKLYHFDMRAVTDMLLQAHDKSNGREWIAGVLKDADKGEPSPPPKHVVFPDEIYRETV